MERIVLIASFGAAGTLARLFVGEWLGRRDGGAMAGWPWGTLTVNVAGCFLIGIVYTALPADVSPAWRAAIGVGLLGAFTTFSTLMWEVLGMLEGGDALAGVAYVGASVMLGMVALLGGVALARAL